MLLDRDCGLVDDGVLRRSPVLEGEVEARELELAPDDLDREDAERLLEEPCPVWSPSRTTMVRMQILCKGKHARHSACI